MIESIILGLGTAAEWWFGLFHGLAYIVPAVICMVVYTLRSFKDVAEDRAAVKAFNERVQEWETMTEEKRKAIRQTIKPEYCRTHRTIGYVLGRWFIALFPVLNVFCAVFDCLADLIQDCVDFLRKVFDINIIPTPRD